MNVLNLPATEEEPAAININFSGGPPDSVRTIFTEFFKWLPFGCYYQSSFIHLSCSEIGAKWFAEIFCYQPIIQF